MALANYLAEIKSSGIYRFVFDKSEIPAEQAQTLRLFVGYSEKGVFNTPVRIETVTEYKRMFGDVNKKLERYGDFFHRSCIQGLANGPILALNVKNFENDEKVKGLSFHASAAPKTVEYGVEDIYDKTGFWYLEPKLLEQATSNADKDYMYIAATDSKACSNTVFMKAYTPKGYNITFKEWYATVMNGEELPAYLEPIANEKLQDYFIKIYVFGGEFTQELVESDFYKKYFTWEDGKPKARTSGVLNAFGEEVDALDTFASNSKSNCIGVYSGITLPDFVTVNNLPLSVADTFNSDNDKHKMMMYVDTDMLFEKADEDNAETEINSLVKTWNRVYATETAQSASQSDNNSDQGGDNNSDPEPQNPIVDNTEGEEDEASEGSLVPFDNIGYYLEGYTYGYAKPVAGTSPDTYTAQSDSAKLAWQNHILDALKGILNADGETYTGYKGLRLRLTDRTAIAYHYMIDTFETFVAPQMKAVLSNICKLRENAVAICNFPKADTIKNFTYSGPDDDEKNYIKNNMIDFEAFCDSSYANRAVVSLPDEDNGASFAFFYTPVKMINPVTGQKYVIPSAALVSNAFMEKYVSRLPYSIVAGPNYGKIVYNNLVGPDYTFSKEDRDELEPYGVNCLVYVPGKGTYINSNQTAKQNPVTALSKAHIRELVIFLQDEVENLLQNYQWEFNTQTLRDKIKAKADVILDTCKHNQGIYAYTTQCDEKNNPPEVIDNEMLILDYAIEPARGAGKMVQQLTIYRTGGLTAVTTR